MHTKEAIERVRTRFNKWALDNEDLAALQALGLVDADNEDDRIRKQIIYTLNQCSNLIDPSLLAEMLTYLEKQKEQKPSLNFEVISSWLRDHIRRYINSEYNEFHHCFEYDGTINVEELIDDLKVVIDNNAFDVDAAFDARESRDNWEYIKEFCDKFGRMPKDMDELDVLVSYVMNKRQKEQPTNEEMLRTLRAEYEKGVADTIAKYEQKPVFRVGDTIIAKDGTDIPQEAFHIERIEDGYYWDKEGGSILIGHQDEFQLIDQKPAERSRKDSYIIGFVYALLNQIEWNDNWAMSKEECLRRLHNYIPEKPAVWSEEDKETIEKTICILETNFKPNEGFTGLDINRSQLVDRLNSLRPQSKQKWGDDDETRLKVITEELERFIMFRNYGTPLSIDDIEWLKNLPERFNLQPKAEWSEEEETVLHNACEFIRHRLNDSTCRNGSIGGMDYKELYEKLKSLRPAWKPNEWQMKWLKDVIETVPMTCRQQGPLESLYADLKKL